MPDYERPELRRYWGYTVKEICSDLNRVVESYHNQGVNDVYLLGHDWGAIIALKYVRQFPNNIRKLVLEDVGVASRKAYPVLDWIRVIAYQLFCALGFLVTRLTRKDAFRFLVNFYPWQLLGLETDDIEPYIRRG